MISWMHAWFDACMHGLMHACINACMTWVISAGPSRIRGVFDNTATDDGIGWGGEGGVEDENYDKKT